MIDPTDKAPARIAGMFDRIAHRYDLLNHLLSAGIDRWWRRRAIRSLDLSGREVVLDLCTGTADVAIAAARARLAARRVIGVDFAGEMLRIGRRKIDRAELSRRIALVRGDASRVPAADASVDAVTIAFGIRNVSDPSVVCREIARVLRAGGRVAILEFATPTLPIVRSIYLWYFRRVLPRLGRAVSRDDSAYGYLPASVSAFAAPDEFVKVLRQAGLDDVRGVPLTLGVVYLYTGRRRESLAAGR